MTTDEHAAAAQREELRQGLSDIHAEFDAINARLDTLIARMDALITRLDRLLLALLVWTAAMLLSQIGTIILIILRT